MASVIAVVIVVAGIGTYRLHSSSTSPSPSPPPTATPSPTPPAPGSPSGATYAVAGNRILADGAPFTPYGMTVFGLSYPQWQSHVSDDEQQIIATATSWHGNTVRIQVAPPDLLDAQPYDRSYLAAIEQECEVAQDHGLDVILTAQYERTTSIPMPDDSTIAFWRIIAPLYAHDPGVWFDLFNEPRLGAGPAGGASQLWEIWQHGGSGHVGMQQLVDTIRISSPNLILAEGVDQAKTLEGLSGHELTGGAIAYAVHPYFEGEANSTPAGWDANWGDISSQVPVVADEWGEYSARTASCHADAPQLVPEFLQYLSSHDIGLIAWSLVPGVLVTGDDLAQPTTFVPGQPFVCGGRSNGSDDPPQGAGADVLAYMVAHSTPAP